MDKMVRVLVCFPLIHLDLHLSSGIQIQTSKGELIITNDGATILKSIQALHPAAKMVRVRLVLWRISPERGISLSIFLLLKMLRLVMVPPPS